MLRVLVHACCPCANPLPMGLPITCMTCGKPMCAACVISGDICSVCREPPPVSSPPAKKRLAPAPYTCDLCHTASQVPLEAGCRLEWCPKKALCKTCANTTLGSCGDKGLACLSHGELCKICGDRKYPRQDAVSCGANCIGYYVCPTHGLTSDGVYRCKFHKTFCGYADLQRSRGSWTEPLLNMGCGAIVSEDNVHLMLMHRRVVRACSTCWNLWNAIIIALVYRIGLPREVAWQIISLVAHSGKCLTRKDLHWLE